MASKPAVPDTSDEANLWPWWGVFLFFAGLITLFALFVLFARARM